MSELNPAMSESDQGDQAEPDEARPPASLSPLVAGVVDVALALHFAAAAFWWWFSPQGFPLTMPQFWTNSVLPYFAMGLACVGLWAMHRDNRPLAAAVVACFSGAWLAVALAGRIAFPASFGGVWVAFFFVALCGAGLFSLLVEALPWPPWSRIPATIVGAVIGLLVVLGQIPPAPSTVPAELAIGIAAPAGVDRDVPSHVALGADVRFLPQVAQLEAIAGGVWFECRPLLEFRSTSPDGFWSLFHRQRPQMPRLVGATGAAPTQTFHYDNGATITFAPPSAGELVAATATTPVAANIYSHLNTYMFIRFNTDDTPALTFSPCGGIPFEVHPADYPFGRPARFAYLDADDTFRVCKATSGEKGPFRTLGSGKLERGESLTIGFQSSGRRIASLVLEDWSSQLSTALSPTAGWGVPVNAIEFQLVETDSDEYVGIWITLAGTSVGRGFDTVGHRAGTYRNRFSIRGGGAGR